MYLKDGMEWRMKNFNIGVHWKIWFLGEGGGLTKKQCIGGNCLKRGAWTVCRFKGLGELGEKRGWWCWIEKNVEYLGWNLNEFKILSRISFTKTVNFVCTSNPICWTHILPETTTFGIFHQIFYHSNWLYKIIKTQINTF